MRLRPFFLLSVLIFGVGSARGSHAGVAASATPVVLGEAPLEIEYHMPGVALRALEDGDTFRIDAGLPLTGASGRPVLPVIPATIVLPAGMTMDQVQVVPEDYSQLAGSYRIEHGARPFVPLPGATPTLTVPDDAIYGSDTPYPGTCYEVVGVQHRRGVALLLVNLYPVVYHPRSGRIAFWRRMSVHVTTRPDTTPSGVRYRPDLVRPLADAVDNPQTLATYTWSRRRGGLRTALCDPSNTFQYVFVTTRDIRDAYVAPNVHALIAHRESHDMTATIVVMEDICTNYPGWDAAEQLRNFIIDAYNNWDTDFVVLGGDTNVVPMRRLWAEVPLDGITDHLPSDLYFQCLDNGNYNENWNDKWGEPNDGVGGTDVDLLADVYIGRISAEDAGEMANAIHKILAYENDDGDEIYKRQVLMCGERLGWTGLMAWGGNFMEELRLGSTNYGYTTVGFTNAQRFTVDTLYDKDAPWDKFDMEERINADQYGIINHLGHCMWYYGMRLYRPDIDQLVNNRFPFAYSQGCWPGAFDYDCAAEHYTTSTRHGLVACIMNSRYGLDPGDAGYGLNSLDGPSQRFHCEFWNGYLSPAGLRCLGVLNAFSHDANAWTVNNPSCLRWSYYESNLLGDPATPLPYAYALRDGLYFDQDDYFSDTRAVVTLHNADTGPETTQTITLTTSGGDSEMLVLHLAGATTNTFTNDILIAYGDPTPDNGIIEGTNRTMITATWPHPVSGVLTAKAVIAVDLYVDITNMPTVLPQHETTFVVAGCNNGNVAVTMTVSNQANGAAAAFTGTNQWTAPPIALTDGINPICVAGVNLYGEGADDEVVIERVGPAGATNYVALNGTHVWPFTSWDTAATTIQSAVDAAYDSNTILVADGLFRENEIVVERPMHLMSVAGAESAIIDGQNQHRCLRIGAEGIVEGFTFRNGYADYGGGAHVVNGNLCGCVLTSNRVDLHGGGVYIGFSGLVEDSRLQGNQAQKGGGVKCDYGGAMSDCDVVGNTALDSGGGLNCHRGGIIVGCRIANNVAQGQFFDFLSELAGGGVFAGGPGPVFNNCLITGNSAPTVDGGGVCCGATVMDRCLIADNSAGNRGGGVSLKLGAELRDCLIARNVSSNCGGGAWCRAGSLLENCTLSGNRVTDPGGQGGGVFLHDGGAFVNCIVAGNAANIAPEIAQASSGTFAFCCAPLDLSGAGNITNDPDFIEASLGNYRLGRLSPCIDAGTNLAGVNIDLDGVSRPVDTRHTGTAVTDIGTYEYHGLGINDFDLDGVSDLAVFWPEEGQWYVRRSSDGALWQTQFGWSAVYPLAENYTGHGYTQPCVFWPDEADWYVRLEDGIAEITQWGWNGTVPVPADYDGDGRTDVAVFNRTTGDWHIHMSGVGRSMVVNWGWNGVIPTPADYDGDGAADLAVYWRAQGLWYIRYSSGGSAQFNWGWNATWPFPCDYDGDGRSDPAIYWPEGGMWYVLLSSGGGIMQRFGWDETEPIPGDYDGDGIADLCVYDQAHGRWYVRRSSDGVAWEQDWGWSAAFAVSPQPWINWLAEDGVELE